MKELIKAYASLCASNLSPSPPPSSRLRWLMWCWLSSVSEWRQVISVLMVRKCTNFSDFHCERKVSIKESNTKKGSFQWNLFARPENGLLRRSIFFFKYWITLGHNRWWRSVSSDGGVPLIWPMLDNFIAHRGQLLLWTPELPHMSPKMSFRGCGAPLRWSPYNSLDPHFQVSHRPPPLFFSPNVWIHAWQGKKRACVYYVR